MRTKEELQIAANNATFGELELSAHALRSAAEWFASKPKRAITGKKAAAEIFEMVDELMREAARKGDPSTNPKP